MCVFMYIHAFKCVNMTTRTEKGRKKTEYSESLKFSHFGTTEKDASRDRHEKEELHEKLLSIISRGFSL